MDNIEEKPKPKRGLKFTLWLILNLWIIAGVVLAALWFKFDADRTAQIASVWAVVPTALFLTMGWWTIFSNLPAKTRWQGWGGLLIAVGLFCAIFRLEQFEGSFWPWFAFRWTPTAESKFLDDHEKDERFQGKLPKPKEESVYQDWTQFRGSNGDGLVEKSPIRRDWSNGPPEPVWKKRVGPGWSSFIVVEGLLYTQMQIDQDEAVVCYEMNSGKIVWEHKEPGVRFSEIRAGVGPMATPTYYQGRLYTLGATGILNCLDPKTGLEFWSTNILEDANSENLDWGMAGSPVAYEGMILVTPGSDEEEKTGVAAYDWKTGKKLWAGGHHIGAYSTPVIAKLDGMTQLLVFDGKGLSGHALNNGYLMWHHRWENTFNINVAKPILRDDDAIFISTGYGVGSALIRVTNDGNNHWSVKLTDWETNSKFKLKFGDAVKREGLVYGLSEGILMCLDLKTGNILWRQRGDFGFGQLIMVEDVLVILTEQGEVVLIEANQNHKELLRFQAIEGKSWSYPTFAQGRLFVRNAEWMACYDLRPEKEEK